MSSLNKILKKWNEVPGKQDQKISVENWLNTYSNVDQEFAKNLQADCALNGKAASELAELLSKADTLTIDQFRDNFLKWGIHIV